LEWRDLPPVGLIPQAPTKYRRRRDPVTGEACWQGGGQGLGPPSDTKLQHFATICGGWAANSVTLRGIHANVTSEGFPALLYW